MHVVTEQLILCEIRYDPSDGHVIQDNNMDNSLKYMVEPTTSASKTKVKSFDRN